MKNKLGIAALLVVLLLLTAIPAWAGQDMGSSPYTADLLVSGLNTGRLNPGQEYWYAYSRLDLGDPDYNGIILSLNFTAEGRAVANRVNFQVFDFQQVDAWLKDNSSPVASLGLGTPASADFDANTGERLWSGRVAESEVYYVRIFNLSPSPVQYRLTVVGQKSGFDVVVAVENGAGGEDPAVIPAAMSVPANGAGITAPAEPVPQAPAGPIQMPALPVQPDNTGTIPTGWLLAAQAIEGLPPQEAAAWLMSAARLGWLPLGAGSPALMPVDPNADNPVVTTGGSGDGGSPAGEPAAIPVDPNRGDSIYPNQPLKLLTGPNTGRLAPGAEHWYTFTADWLDGNRIKNYSLTMFFTPGEPNIARYVTFEMFTGSQYQLWSRGTPRDMENFGAGSWVSRDGDYNTGERLWHGTVVDGDKYLVKITNGTKEWVDYHLLTGDIINTELGPRAKLAETIVTSPAATAPTGEDIGSPLPVRSGRTTGRLEAETDLWFVFESKSSDPDKFEFQHYVMRLDHTPGVGYVTNGVNLEIYPFQEQHLWRRGDTDQIQPLGAGSDAFYDRPSDTHTWAWDGHLVSNTTYFIRIRNDSVADINFDLLIQRR